MWTQPSEYLRYDTAGRVLPEDDLSPTEYKRAEQTIRVFNLNSEEAILPRLRIKAWATIEEEVRELQSRIVNHSITKSDLARERELILARRYTQEFSACLKDLIYQFLPLASDRKPTP